MTNDFSWGKMAQILQILNFKIFNNFQKVFENIEGFCFFLNFLNLHIYYYVAKFG
jgi:GTP cyclohydrolase III